MGEGWGIELWDRFKEVCDVVNDDTDNLDKVFKAYMKERSKIETEYARGLKGLCKKYNNTKHNKKQANDEEYTKVTSFREILKQLEFQANQHEILAETLGFEQSKLVDQRVKESRNQLKNYRKEQKDAEINLQKSYKSLDASKLKYQKSYSDRELAKTNYEKAEVDGTYSRNDVAKLKNLFLQKDRNNEESKAQYANQMGKTNKDQQEYFDTQMTTILQNLEKLHKDNISFWIETSNNCVNIEVSVKGIIAKCHESMLAEISKANADTDAELVITNFKTGNVPPEDFQFEELGPQMTAFGTLSRSQTNLTVDSSNLYQKKRELKKTLEEKKKEEASAQKEMKALHMMVETYKNNPKFGDARKFQSELDAANAKTQKIGSELQELQSNLSTILNQLERKSSRSPMIDKSRSKGSFSSNTSYSSNNNIPNSVPDTDFDDDDDEFDNVSVLSLPVPPVVQNSSAPAPPPPPPLPSSFQPAESKEIFATAIYAYETETEDTLNIAEGDKFIVLEMDDDGEGWTNVRRVADGMEGFVLTSYIDIAN